MYWFLTEERELIRNIAREFTQEEVAPRAKEIDLKAEFPWDLVNRMKELNFFGIPIPEEYGGIGADLTSLLLVMEEVAKEAPVLGAILECNTSVSCMPLLMSGTEDQKQKYLVPAAKAEKIAAFALTEPNAGSDAGSTQCRAVLDGDEWIINGSKCFITLAGVAETYILTAKIVAPDGKLGGVTAFIAEKDYPGFEVGKMEKKLGMHGSQTGELFFRNMRIPKGNMLGQENKGLGIFLTALGDGRLAAAAVSLGAAEGAFEKTLAYAKQRVQFNNPLSHFQAIQFYLADMATEIECGRNMIYSAAALGDAGKPYAIEAAMAKLWATDMGQRVTNQCIQIHGGLGYVTDFGIDRYWRDTRVWAIGDGANEIQKIIISRHLLS